LSFKAKSTASQKLSRTASKASPTASPTPAFAASYPKTWPNSRTFARYGNRLETAEIDIALVKQPTQLTLEGWPTDSIRPLGKQRAAELVTLLNGDAIYDEIVGSDARSTWPANIGTILAGAESFPAPVQRTIASRLASVLAIRFEPKKGEEDAETD